MPEPPDTEKTRLRRKFGAARRAMSDADREQARADVRSAVLQRCGAAGWQRVAAYQPMPTEPGSTQLLHDLTACGVEVLVPLTLPDRDLDWAVWAPASAVGEPLGVTAIGSVAAALVPALAVALDGTRLGRGGGSYDRALGRCTAGTVVAALLYDGEVVPTLPRDAWDLPVGAVVTPSGWRVL